MRLIVFAVELEVVPTCMVTPPPGGVGACKIFCSRITYRKENNQTNKQIGNEKERNEQKVIHM